MRDFFIQLGGTAIIARELSEMLGHEFKRRRIDKWQQTGYIPWRWRGAVRRLAFDKGVSLPRELREQEEPAKVA